MFFYSVCLPFEPSAAAKVFRSTFSTLVKSTLIYSLEKSEANRVKEILAEMLLFVEAAALAGGHDYSMAWLL